MTVRQLRQWLGANSYKMPYMIYARREQLVRWIEQHVECPRCPTCGQPI